ILRNEDIERQAADHPNDEAFATVVPRVHENISEFELLKLLSTVDLTQFTSSFPPCRDPRGNGSHGEPEHHADSLGVQGFPHPLVPIHEDAPRFRTGKGMAL